MHKLGFYVPESHVARVKAAVFAAGAGRIGNYDQCCWQVKGQGQFRPLAGSDPFLGSQGKVENLEEYRVEVVCADDVVSSVVAAMREAHPSEEPAWDLVQMVTDLP